MKKIFIMAAVALISLAANATVIFENVHHVDWENGYRIDASYFNGLTTPHELIVTYSNASDGIEFKRLNVWDQLYFSQYRGIEGEGSVSKVLTPDALATLADWGLEIVGANFNLLKVELVENLDYTNYLWSGFFWMDEWTTIEMGNIWYIGIDWSKYEAIRFYSEANRTDYVINVLTAFDDPDKKLGDQTTMTMTNEYAELTLTDDIRTKLAAANQLMVQCNKESGDPFNMTAFVLIPKPHTPSAVENAAAEVKAAKHIINGQLVIEREGRLFNATGAEL